MTPNESKQALLERLDSRTNRTIGGVLQVMLDFYESQRCDGCAIDQDGDMLLYQWGTFDWGNGEHFELDITRQFILEGEDEPYQLHMTLRLDPTDDCRQVGNGNRWCVSPSALREFRDFIQQSAPHRLLGARACPEIAVTYGQC
jgi:hypothetical protein